MAKKPPSNRIRATNSPYVQDRRTPAQKAANRNLAPPMPKGVDYKPRRGGGGWWMKDGKVLGESKTEDSRITKPKNRRPRTGPASKYR